MQIFIGRTQNVGGVVGEQLTSGDRGVKNSINYGEISVNIECLRCGGIVGCVSSGTVEECANKGICSDLSGAAGGTTRFIGGICGGMGEKSRVLNCYVSSNLGNGECAVTGGITGNIFPSSEISNCYICSTIDYHVYAVKGNLNYNDTLSNCYYNSDNYTSTYEENVATGLTTEEMKSSSFVSMLGDKFKSDTNNINDGYPILSFE